MTLRIFDVGNERGLGIWVVADTELRATQLAAMYGHGSRPALMTATDVTAAFAAFGVAGLLRQERMGVLTPISDIVPLTLRELVAGAVPKPVLWKLDDRPVQPAAKHVA